MATPEVKFLTRVLDDHSQRVCFPEGTEKEKKEKKEEGGEK